ncbi:tail fiber [Escherichia phage pEC-M719-6WT.1]|uniref:Tail fiber n=1 Tax=Escherichia phage pEC-M719-6WT.1 TaxID=3056220 RepID=A0AA51YF63_9CAUD|nr:tail fiber [Escherichia phage pEC-M719-6WT.1]
MAVGEIQISALPQASLPIGLSDIFHLKQGIEDKRCTLEQLLAPHASLKNNPHEVTKNQVGLSSVINALQLVAANNLSDVVNVQEARTNLGILSSDQVNALIQAHIDDKNNPHNTTKSQVGLGNLQNWTYSNSYSEDADRYATARAVNALYRAIQDSYPIGTIHLSVNPANPSSYLLCGGTWELVSKGRSLVGYDTASRPVESTFGSQTVTLGSNNLPAHTHSVYLAGGSHNHDAIVSISGFDYGVKSSSSFDYGTKTSNLTGAHKHTISGTAASNGSHSHTSTDYFINEVVAGNNYALNGGGGGYQHIATRDTSSAGLHTHSISGSTSSSDAHAHTVSIGAHEHTVNIGAHNHNGSVSISSTDHTHSGTTGAAGAGQGFSIEQPSYVVYVWKRVA